MIYALGQVLIRIVVLVRNEFLLQALDPFFQGFVGKFLAQDKFLHGAGSVLQSYYRS